MRNPSELAPRGTLLAGAVFLASLGCAMAEEPQAATVTGNASIETKLPSGEAVLEMYVKATGGREKYAAVETRVTNATLEIPAQRVTMSLTVYHARPDKIRVKAEIPKVGTLDSGVFDGVAWEISPTTGPRVKSGDEAEYALRDARLDKWLNWRDSYASLECTGVVEVESKPCFKVVATPLEGKPLTLYFERDSHLLLRVESPLESKTGPLTMTTFLRDYQPFGGILMPRTTITQLMAQERILTTESVEVNGTLPEGTFELPEEIRKLIDEKQPVPPR